MGQNGSNGAVPIPTSPAFTLGAGEDRFVRPVGRPLMVRSPADAAGYVMEVIFPPTAILEQEELWIILLNRKHRASHEVLLYRGNQSSDMIRLAEAFREAVRLAAAGIIVAHCHPSGIPDPSPEDIQITRQLIEAGKLLEVEVLDHLIFGDGRWVSLRERGLCSFST